VLLIPSILNGLSTAAGLRFERKRQETHGRGDLRDKDWKEMEKKAEKRNREREQSEWVLYV